MRIVKILIFLLIFSSALFAESVKIGYVDMQKIIFNSNLGKQARQKLMEFHQKKQAEIDKKQSEIEKLKDEIAKKGAFLSQEAREEKENRLTKLQIELKRFIEDARAEERDMESKLVNKILTKAFKVIQKIGKEQNYTLILMRRSGMGDPLVLYGNPSVDLTDEVIKRLNKETAKK